MNEPLERLLVDPVKTDDQVMSRSYGVTVLEYETTMPTKFMCGTDVGMVFVCNRKGKTPVEKINFRVRSAHCSARKRLINTSTTFQVLTHFVVVGRFRPTWGQCVP